MISLSLPRSRKTCGWSNGGLAPTHMNSCEPISMTGTPASLWKCGTTWSDIVAHPGVAIAADTITTDAAFLRRRGPYWRVQMIASPAEPKGPQCPMLICSCKFDTILRPERSPSFVGDVVSQFWHTMSVDEGNCDERQPLGVNDLRTVQALRMKWLRISTALTGMAACGFLLAR